MRVICTAALLWSALAFPSVSRAQSNRPLVGIAQAQDGDSLEINGVRVRLHGIDAPEFDQTCTRGAEPWPCGAKAFEALATLVTGREVRCTNLGSDPFDRVLGRCTVNGLDVNKAMVEKGLALAFRRYSMDYVGAEERAKSAGLGLWSGTFEEPGEVRGKGASPVAVRAIGNGSRSGRSSASATSGACRIKGNKSRRGEWIYHLPGMPYYEQTRAEAMFCSEEEAQAAGYRRARVR